MAGYVREKDALLRRLRRIEGQVRGLQRMVEEERYCTDVVTQIAAAQSALEEVALKLLDSHVRHCARERSEVDPAELMAAVERLVRMR
jgi:CsoR family transcriptional regulator, copper-sensing transcriptional repressor